MKIAFVQADNPVLENSSRWLCHWPAWHLKSKGYDAGLARIPSTVAVMGALDEFDVIVLETPMHLEEHGRAVKKWKSEGKVVLAILDDAYHVIPDEKQVWGRRALKVVPGGVQVTRSAVYKLELVCKMCDAVIVPTKALQAHWEGIVDTVFLVPNRMPLGMMEKRWEAKPVVGYGGSKYHSLSLPETGITEALAKLSVQGVRVQIVGLLDIAQEIMGHGGEVEFIGWKSSYDEWRDALSGWGVGIAPLHGEYDEYRSWVKAMEYASMGIPWVVTDGLPYEGALGGVKIDNSVDGWYWGIHDMLFDEALRKLHSTVGFEWARTQAIDDSTEWRKVMKQAKEMLG